METVKLVRTIQADCMGNIGTAVAERANGERVSVVNNDGGMYSPELGERVFLAL